MGAVINLRREPKLREQFEYVQVVNNTVLIDRRTRWGNPFRVGGGVSYAEAVARSQRSTAACSTRRMRWTSVFFDGVAGYRVRELGRGEMRLHG